MVRYFFILMIIVHVQALPVHAASSTNSLQNVVFLTEHLPPYSYQDGDIVTGIGPDALQAALHSIGSKKNIRHMPIYPWARTYYQTQIKPNYCALVTIRTKEREPLFKWAGPIADFDLVFISKKGSVTINNLDDARQYNIGVVREGISEQLLLKHNFNPKRMDKSTTTNFLFDKLDRGRIDAVLSDKMLVDSMIQSGNFAEKDYEINLIVGTEEGYIACNPETSDEVMELLQKGIDNITASGELESIVRHHLTTPIPLDPAQ